MSGHRETTGKSAELIGAHVKALPSPNHTLIARLQQGSVKNYHCVTCLPVSVPRNFQAPESAEVEHAARGIKSSALSQAASSASWLLFSCLSCNESVIHEQRFHIQTRKDDVGQTHPHQWPAWGWGTRKNLAFGQLRANKKLHKLLPKAKVFGIICPLVTSNQHVKSKHI